MTDSHVLVLVILAGLVFEAIWIVRPGQMMFAPDWRDRYRADGCLQLIPGQRFAIMLSPLFPLSAALRVGGDLPADTVTAFDLDRARNQFERFGQATWWLLVPGQLMFVYLVIVVPAVMVFGLLQFDYIWLGGVLLGLQLVFVPTFLLANRSLPEDLRHSPWQHLFVMFLFPPAVVFAAGKLAGPLFQDIHPLTAALALCPEDEARKLAGTYLRRWRHPLPDDEVDLDPTHLAPAEAMLAGHGWDPAGFLGAPDREEGSAAYCPRCEAQYIDRQGDCPDCSGVKKVGF